MKRSIRYWFWKHERTLSICLVTSFVLVATASCFVLFTGTGSAALQRGVDFYTEWRVVLLSRQFKHAEDLMGAGDFDRAAMELSDLLECLEPLSLPLKPYGPLRIRALRRLADAYEKQGKRGRALATLRATVSANPRCAEDYARLGLALVADGADDEGMWWLVSAAHLDPRRQDVAEAMVRHYAAKGQHASVVRVIEQHRTAYGTDPRPLAPDVEQAYSQARIATTRDAARRSTTTP
jgi:tetratricopeptide (TPR) repeat protein